jgi:hypothetical protein
MATVQRGVLITAAIAKAITLAAICFFPVSANAASSCSNKSLSGSFGYTFTGQTVSGNNPGPHAAVGVLTANGQGGLTGFETKSIVGTISNVTFAGSYSIQSNCTGTAAITESDGEVRNFNLALLHSDWIAIQTDSGQDATATGSPILGSSCTNKSISGKFGHLGTGQVFGGNNPGGRAVVGTHTADGKGNITTWTDTVSRDGTVENVTGTGTYTMLTNCTGTITLVTGGAGFFLVLLKNGGMMSIVLTSGDVVTVTSSPLL